MERLLATAELIPTKDSEGTNMLLSARTTAGFFVQGEVTLDAALALRRQITAAVDELSRREHVSEVQSLERARALAMNRTDAFVNSKAVLCAHDHCGTRQRAEGGDHPWNIAIRRGWTVIFNSDLLCDDCSGPQENCPWKKKKVG
jgi:hypothetical protein